MCICVLDSYYEFTNIIILMMMDSKETQVKRITDQILLRVKASFQNHKRKVEKFNTEKSYPGGLMKSEAMQSFYGPLNNLSDSLIKLQKSLGKSQKIRKERKRLYEAKTKQFIENIQIIRKNKHSIRIKVNDYLIKLIQETFGVIEEVALNLKNYEHEAGIMCGKAYDCKPALESSMTELIARGHLWGSLSKFESVTNDSIKQIYLSVEYNEDQFKHIEKQIKNVWPDPEVQLQVVQKEVIVPEVRVQDDSHLREAIEMLYGFTQPQNITKALQIYNKEERKSKCHPKALVALGHLYEEGRYVPKDLNKAVNYFKRAADMNEPEGLYKIGIYLQKGSINSKHHFKGMYPNREAQIRGGIQYYEKAAKLGHLDAITDLGYIYEKGVLSEDGSEYFIDPHPNHALKYYLLGKKEDYPRAYNNLGNLYITCKQLKEEVEHGNVIKGIKYLEKAVELKYMRAFMNLGKCYENGIGVNESMDRARALYLQGAELGDIQCKLEYVKSCFGYKLNNENTLIKMVELTRQVLAQDSRNEQALFYMGLFFEQGVGVEKNKQSSFYYIETAARLQYGPAITKLGDYYYAGYFVPKDIDYARTLYEKAALKNDPKAVTSLGILAQKGIGMVENDPKRAQVLYEQGAELGNPNALILLSQTNQHKIDTNEALTEAASMGSKTAMRLVKGSNIMVPKKKKQPQQYTQTLKNMQSHYLKSGFRST